MPFVSRAQEKAAFGGYLGSEMKSKAQEWAKQTDQASLPEHVKSKSKPKPRIRKMTVKRRRDLVELK